MEALLVSFGLVFVAELGDKTQFFALMLASRFGRPWAILAGIFAAVAAHHSAAAAVGFSIGARLDGAWLKWVVAASFFAVAVWALIPVKAADEAAPPGRFGAFGAAFVAFFLGELGDKTEVATAALAAHFASLVPIVAGTTLAMLAANAPVVLLGRRLGRWMALPALRWGTALVAAALGVMALVG